MKRHIIKMITLLAVSVSLLSSCMVPQRGQYNNRRDGRRDERRHDRDDRDRDYNNRGRSDNYKRY